MRKLNKDNISIHWTEYHIPHIQADSFQALGFGYGYVHATDRLAEISAQAIILRGQRSLHFGAENFSSIGFLKTTNLNSDLMFRLRLPNEWIQEELTKLNTDTRQYIQGYVDGINHYVSNMTKAEQATTFANEPMVTFEVEDVIRSTMRFGVMKELIEIGPQLIASSTPWQNVPLQNDEYSLHKTAIEIEGGFGSNAWAYGGDVTANQSAILLGNPHSAWKRTPHEQRIYMHQYHLTIPGKLDVAGSSFLGFPLPMTGYNADVSWTILDAATVTPFLLQKMQVETVEGKPCYLMDDQYKPLEIKNISIKVLEKSGKIETRKFLFAHSELGPLYQLPQKTGKTQGWYAITNPNESNAQGLDQFLSAAQTKSTRDFVQKIEDNRGILCQLLVADNKGDIAYVIAGNVPPVADEKMAVCHIGDNTAAFNVLDGSKQTSSFRDNDGKPLHADKSFYPTLISRGIIHNTNNSYKYSEWGKVQANYAAVFGQHKKQHQVAKHIAAGLRYDPRLAMSTQRIKEICGNGNITEEKIMNVLFDNRNYAAEKFLDRILSLKQSGLPESIQQGMLALSKWDRKNNSDSQGALLFHLFWSQIIKADLLKVPASGDPTLETKFDMSPDNIQAIFDALTHSVTQLKALGFQLDTAWGEVLFQKNKDVLIPLHGGSYQEGILNGEMPAPLTKAGFPYILFGTAYIQLTQWRQGKIQVNALLSHGQRDDPLCPEKSKQLKKFANKQLPNVPFFTHDINSDNTLKKLSLTLPPN